MDDHGIQPGPKVYSWAAGKGAPSVPQLVYRFVLPNGDGAKELTLGNVESRYPWGRYDLLPSNPRSRSQMRSRELPPIYRDDDIYDSYRRYPGELVRMGDMIVQRGVGMVDFLLNPVQYWPASERIEVYTKISFEVKCGGASITAGMSCSPGMRRRDGSRRRNGIFGEW